MRVAAIDIGSNAVRCLISEVTSADERPTKLKLLRVPLRLGFDTFLQGEISQKRADNVIRLMKCYRLLMDIYEVEHYRACATSAMRDAKNGPDLVTRIRQETDLEIDIISGQEEAHIIFETHAADKFNHDKNYLYIDVGGGSTDLTLFSQGEEKVNNSFNIGTIRLLNNQVSGKAWKEMRTWLDRFVKPEPKLAAVGSGGNINTIYQLARRKKGTPLSSEYIKKFCGEINVLSIEERMRKYAMKPDRADVVNHACKIFCSVLDWTGIKKMYVPQIGVVDGIVQKIAEDWHGLDRS